MSETLEALQHPESPAWFRLGEDTAIFEAALKEAEEANAARRLWGREGGLWSEDEWTASHIEERLGWLDLPQSMRIEIPRLKALAAEIRAADIRHVVLLGMGGSSLAPEVMGHILGDDQYPHLTILDSTDPLQIRHATQSVPLGQTLFLIASKSGTTAETRNLYLYFKHAVREKVSEEHWSNHFVAITDPGTPLEEIARREDFRTVYLNPTDIGGRYSALSFYGLVPASLVGVDLDELLRQAKEMAWECRAGVPAENNPGLVLGAIMGGLARHSEPRDKMTLITSPQMSPFGAWAEQMLAESTGKEGTGILPVDREPPRPAGAYGHDRLFVYVRLATDDNKENDKRVTELIAEEHPVVVLNLPDIHNLGGEFFRWEFATAIAGYLLNINPFNQPNVEAAKTQARNALTQYEETKTLPKVSPVLQEGGFKIYGPETGVESMVAYLASFLGDAEPDDYIAILAYVERNREHDDILQEMRRLLGEKTGLATTAGFGPRYLHSTGQLHKGGRNNGLFLQITYTPEEDLPIPTREYTFSVFKRAQALGDLEALREADRRAIRVHIDRPLASGLQELTEIIQKAL
ncbi:MAG: hypothetical protein ACLFV5_00120 [Anaerolineales bacterium]